MIRKLCAPACVLIAAVAVGCASTGSGTADCGAAAYQNAFGGGDYYDIQDLSQVSGILRNESVPVSEDADRRLTNLLGVDGAAAVKRSFAQCKAQQPAPAG